MPLLPELCVFCSRTISPGGAYRLCCTHRLCFNCTSEMTESNGSTPTNSKYVHISCPKCNVMTPFQSSELPDKSHSKDIIAGFSDLNISSSEDDLGWEETSSETRYLSECAASEDQLAKIRTLLTQAEDQLNKQIRIDSDKLSLSLHHIQKDSAKKFSEVMKKLQTSSHEAFQESEKSVNKRTEYFTKSVDAYSSYCDAKIESLSNIENEIEKTSFVTASLNDISSLYKRCVKLENEISQLNSIMDPRGTYHVNPAAQQFFTTYCKESFGSFETRARGPTPVPDAPNDNEKPAEQKELSPNPTPSPDFVIKDELAQVKEEKVWPVQQDVGSLKEASSRRAESTVKVESPVEQASGPQQDVRLQQEVTPRRPESKVKVESKIVIPTPKSASPPAPSYTYDYNMYSRMSMFATITSISSDSASLRRPVGCCTMPGFTRRRAAVVHSGHKISVFSAAANLLGTYVISDPDRMGRIQLVGDISADKDGNLFIIDRDNLPSRIMIVPAERFGPNEKTRQTIPIVFARFTGRIRIYGIAVSPSKNMVYTSSRTRVHGISIRSGQVVMEVSLRYPPTAYIHSMFEVSEDYTPRSAQSEPPYLAYTANEGKSVYITKLLESGELELKTDKIASSSQNSRPISLVRRTCCDPVGNVLGADSGNKEIRVFSSSGEHVARFSPPASYGKAFSASGVAVLPAHPNQSPSHLKTAERCAKGKTHLGPVVVVADFETHRILFFDVPTE